MLFSKEIAVGGSYLFFALAKLAEHTEKDGKIFFNLTTLFVTHVPTYIYIRIILHGKSDHQGLNHI